MKHPYANCANCNSCRYQTEGVRMGAWWCFVFRRGIDPRDVCAWFIHAKSGIDLKAVLSPGSYVTPGLSLTGETFPPNTAQKIIYSNGQKVVREAPPGTSLVNGMAFKRFPG